MIRNGAPQRKSKRSAPYQLLPPLRPEEVHALRVDIEKRGVQVPVELDDQTGNILDGHHRAAIAAELGIKYPTIRRRFKTEAEKREHVFSLNLRRRHLPPHEWGAAFARLLECRGIKRGQGARNDNGTSDTVSEVAAEFGVNERTARRRLREADYYAALPQEKRCLVDQGRLDLSGAVKQHHREKKAATRKRLAAKAAKEIRPGDAHDILHGDFRDVADNIPDGSVDLIFTDPLYDRASLPLFGDLAQVAARVLKPRGSLVTYVRQCYLPEVLNLMTPHLRFYWPIVSVMERPDFLEHMGIVARKKLLGWFVNMPAGGGRFKGVRGVDDMVQSNWAKAHHTWEQSVIEASYYIDRLTEPGDLVFEPFCGSGTTCVAAKRLGRKWLGCDIDADAVAIARKRVHEAQSQP